MARTASAILATLALVLGLAIGLVGLMVMLDAGSFASGESRSSSGPLGLWGSSSQTASIDTPAYVGLVLALVGAGVMLAGLRAAFETAAR